jgi:hypothetical protein
VVCLVNLKLSWYGLLALSVTLSSVLEGVRSGLGHGKLSLRVGLSPPCKQEVGEAPGGRETTWDGGRVQKKNQGLAPVLGLLKRQVRCLACGWREENLPTVEFSDSGKHHTLVTLRGRPSLLQAAPWTAVTSLLRYLGNLSIS